MTSITQGKISRKPKQKANGASMPKKSSETVAKPETLRESPLTNIDDIRNRVQLSVGQAVLLMANLPRYRSQTLADLTHLVLEPLLRDRIAIATAKSADLDSNASETLAGMAIWASVDEATDIKIREQIGAGAFPIRLKPDEWVSGDTLWLLDIVASDQKLATAVLASFNQIALDRPVNIHPIVSRSVEQVVLDKLRSRNESDSL